MYFLSLAAPCGKSDGSESWALSEGFSINLDWKSGSASCNPNRSYSSLKTSNSEFCSDTYGWRWPVKEDGSIADCFVTLDDKPDTESEEERDGYYGVERRLWV